jgi:hypothetical protein
LKQLPRPIPMPARSFPTQSYRNSVSSEVCNRTIKQAFRQVNISSVTVGGHVVNNVHAGVTPDGSDMLLGLSVLAQVAPKFAINIAANTLDFE